jgi:hypothetical protein
VRWDPNREDVTFFDQSAHLYAAYYQLQIMIHRPFVVSQPGSGAAGAARSFPSLAICTHAARACAKVVHTHVSRMGRITFNQIVSVPVCEACMLVLNAWDCRQPAVTNSGVVLILSIWGRRRMGTMVDPTTDMADVNKCLEVLKTSEKLYVASVRIVRSS